MMDAPPTIGRIVHYYPRSISGVIGQPLAALVLNVWSEADRKAAEPHLARQDPCVDLCVYKNVSTSKGRTLTEHVTLVPYSPTPKPGHWTWPPRV